MLWALIFTLILNNDPAFVFPNLEKQVKKHITDKERKKEILELRKDSEKARNKFSKEKKKTLKGFNKLFISQATTKDELEDLFNKKNDNRKRILDSEMQRIAMIQELIHTEEWNTFLENKKDELKQHNKDRKEKEKALNANYNKALKKINANIYNKPTKQKVTNIATNLFTTTNNYIICYYKYIQDNNSIVYSSEFNIENLISNIEEINLTNDKIVLFAIDGHSQLKDLATPTEWKVISKILTSFKY